LARRRYACAGLRRARIERQIAGSLCRPGKRSATRQHVGLGA
ncbi:hypothetical protein AZ019_001974, partial [Klebsiella pneumoniae]